MAFFEKDFLNFFIELAANNNKDWFDKNRSRYEQKVRDPFKEFVQHLITRVEQGDPRFKGLEAKDCIFRINRDIRFSKDKTPYKLMTSAVIAPEGKKSKSINGVYFELTPEHVRVYGGIYEIERDDLLAVREGISANQKKFKALYTAPEFVKTFGKILGEKNKILPPDLKTAAETEPLIYNKQWYFYTEFKPETILKDNLDEVILNCFRIGKPIERFFSDLIKR